MEIDPRHLITSWVLLFVEIMTEIVFMSPFISLESGSLTPKGD